MRLNDSSGLQKVHNIAGKIFPAILCTFCTKYMYMFDKANMNI